jgi:hypothetical protein
LSASTTKNANVGGPDNLLMKSGKEAEKDRNEEHAMPLRKPLNRRSG